MLKGLEWAKTNASNTPGRTVGYSQHSAKGRFCLENEDLFDLRRLSIFQKEAPPHCQERTESSPFPIWILVDYVHDDARSEILWYQRHVTSVQITLHYRRSILSMKPNQTHHTWDQRLILARDTHSSQCTLFVLFGLEMTLLVTKVVL